MNTQLSGTAQVEVGALRGTDFETLSPPQSQSIGKTLLDLENVYKNKINLLQKSCKRAQLIFNVLSILSIILNLCGTIVGTTYPIKCRNKFNNNVNKIVLGLLSGLGILLQTFLKLYEYEKKIYFRKLGVVQYKQIFNKIQAFRRSNQIDLNSENDINKEFFKNFITEINILEDLISDVCPLVKDGFV